MKAICCGYATTANTVSAALTSFAGIKLGLTKIKYTKTNRANGDDEENRKEKCICESCISIFPFPNSACIVASSARCQLAPVAYLPIYKPENVRAWPLNVQHKKKKKMERVMVCGSFTYIYFLRNFLQFFFFTEHGSSL